MFAHGVEKLFFHAGTGSAINHGNLWTMFLRYGNEPFKNYATQAVMAGLLTPDCKFVKKLLPSCLSKPTFTDYRFFAASKQHWSLDPVH